MGLKRNLFKGETYSSLIFLFQEHWNIVVDITDMEQDRNIRTFGRNAVIRCLNLDVPLSPFLGFYLYP